MKTQFADNPAYREAEALLRRLHELLAQGLNDTPAVDPIHDRLDQLEPDLGPAEIERLKGLSADLYMFDGKEIREDSDLPPEELQRRMNAARSQGRWAEVLALMRQRLFALSPDKVAFLRSVAYEHLGHIDTALVFMKHAAHLNPGSEDYAIGALTLMRRLGADVEAAQYIDHVLQIGGLSAPARIYCANELFAMAGNGPLTSASERLVRRALDVLIGVRTEVASREAALPPIFAVTGLVTLGACYERLGDLTQAEKAYSDALAVTPDDADALALRGLLRERVGNAAGIADLKAAIEHNVPVIAPYLIVARKALADGDYDLAITTCDQAYGRTRRPETRAGLLQWKAIAQCASGYPMTAVVRNAQRAADLDPLNPVLQETLNKFLVLDQSGTASPVPPPQDLYAFEESHSGPYGLLSSRVAA